MEKNEANDVVAQTNATEREAYEAPTLTEHQEWDMLTGVITS